MSDDTDDGEGEEELGETADQLGGIAGRMFDDGESDTTKTTEATEATEATETTDTTQREATPSPEMTETTETSEATEATETTGTTEATETIEASEATDTPQPGDEDFDLKEHWNGRTVYLSDDVVADVEDVTGGLQGDFRREHGRQMKMNRDFYPAVFRSALHGTSLREELGLDAVAEMDPDEVRERLDETDRLDDAPRAEE
jgi:hypothetical protein